MSLPQPALPGPALAMLDVGQIPPALRALDALIKEAPVQVVAAGTIQGGRYLILFAGEVEPVEMSMDKALAAAGSALLDSVLLPHAERRILPAVCEAAVRWPLPGDTLGALQCASSPSMLGAVDRALKGAQVDLVLLRTGDGLGGQAIAMLWGEISDVQAAISLAQQAFARARVDDCSAAVIPNADAEVARALAPQSTFFRSWRG